VPLRRWRWRWWSRSPASLSAWCTHAAPRFTEVEVPGHLADAAIAALTTFDDLSLELGDERPSGTGLLPFHGLEFWTSRPGQGP
jgi:hypothetical protein